MTIREIPLDTFIVKRGEVLEQTAAGTLYLCPPEGLVLAAAGEPGAPVGGISWEGMRWLTIEAECLEEHSAAFDLCLWEQGTEGEFDLRIMFGILPGMLTPVPIALKNLESQEIFPERTKGRLKMGVFGKPVDWRGVDRVTLVTTPLCSAQRIRIRAAYLSDEEPEIRFTPRPRMDALGQWAEKSWPGKQPDRAACDSFLREQLRAAEAYGNGPETPERDGWGGWSGLALEKTGWFHVQKADGRWWLADPEGNAFFSTGMDCVRPGTDTRVDVMGDFVSWLPPKEGEYAAAWLGKGGESVNYGVANLISAFGPEHWWECWAKIARTILKKHGFNTIGNWSQMEFIRFAGMPYVLPLSEYSPVGFPSTEKMVFRDFPDVFAPEYEANCRRFGESLEPFAGDPGMIGYFMRNEPAWAFVYGLCIAEELLANPEPLACKRRLIQWLTEKYQTPEALSRAWKHPFGHFEQLLVPLHHACAFSAAARADLEAFSGQMITRYVELPARQCRRVDPNHLNLGMRYAYITDKSLLAGFENFDVFSINSYQMNPFEQIEGVGQLLDKPVLIGEFHHGALDRGLTATGIRAVENQAERGAAYRYYVEQGARSPYFLGGHYFQFNDQSCLGRFDGENYQIGIVDVCMREYTEFVKEAALCHEGIYRVAAGLCEPEGRLPHEIPTIHY